MESNSTSLAEKVKEKLSDFSPKDKPWDTHRAHADDVQAVYGLAKEFAKYAFRISKCSGFLNFGECTDEQTGEVFYRLREARFCRVRNCPVCQWRRTLMWQARFYQALPKIQAENPNARWLLLTLTVRNCEIEQLGTTLDLMNTAWRKLIKRKALKPVLGWVRTTEVTRGADGTAHPHFHVLLMVRSYWFTTGYVTQAEWVQMWQECAKLSYAPNVDIRAVKPKKGQDETTALSGAVAETLKYAVKPSDMVADENWFLEMTRQVHKRRFVATGGVLKDVFQISDETEQDLLVQGEESVPDDENRVSFGWNSEERHYLKK